MEILCFACRCLKNDHPYPRTRQRKSVIPTQGAKLEAKTPGGQQRADLPGHRLDATNVLKI